MNIMLFQIYQQKQDMADAIPVLLQAAQSQYAAPDQQKLWLKNIALYYFQQKDFAKALDVADQAVKHGVNDLDTLGLIAKAEYLTGKYKDAAVSEQEVVNKQEKPDEDSLKLLWQFDLRAEDNAGAAKAVEKLVTYYPKPEYWANALAPLVRMDIKDAHLQLNVYRLMNDVGVLKLPSDYAEMAEIALDAGYPARRRTCCSRRSQRACSSSSATRTATSTCSRVPSSAPRKIRRSSPRLSRTPTRPRTAMRWCRWVRRISATARTTRQSRPSARESPRRAEELRRGQSAARHRAAAAAERLRGATGVRQGCQFQQRRLCTARQAVGAARAQRLRLATDIAPGRSILIPRSSAP